MEFIRMQLLRKLHEDGQEWSLMNTSEKFQLHRNIFLIMQFMRIIMVDIVVWDVVIHKQKRSQEKMLINQNSVVEEWPEVMSGDIAI
eukprot:CAMPEP_0114384944 /NCGR_PEP_ID=MMETSP0102-20121206/5679_1 /TAXON_ID=38822 ORGANISM="Pteridomonas danica, Strain PT" /NCGR_SAMPLE_ID=MMETSP0102 /ASSEMBLY_ACC=CAM_ASM_000212 /LENGTH=86 /DNA_ID=CAMNT_0001541379 /DNA_START=140 /DNA_END=400 /DNA_ORIENTATION=+